MCEAQTTRPNVPLYDLPFALVKYQWCVFKKPNYTQPLWKNLGCFVVTISRIFVLSMLQGLEAAFSLLETTFSLIVYNTGPVLICLMSCLDVRLTVDFF